MPDCRTLLLVCVYLPFDNGLYSGHFEFQETLDQLEGFIDSQDYDMLAVVGDFNVDFSRTDRPQTNDLLQFMYANSLIAKDLDFPDVQFTYESDDGLHALWVDHVLISPTCVQRIQEITVICSGMNLSDHRPLCVKLDCAYTCTQSGHQCHLSFRHTMWHSTKLPLLRYWIVDGAHGDASIVNLWVSKFVDLT